MIVDSGSLFVHLGKEKDEILLPINAIKAVVPASSRWAVYVYLKDEYHLNDSSPLYLYGHTLEQIQDKINQTIINAINKIKEDA